MVAEKAADSSGEAKPQDNGRISRKRARNRIFRTHFSIGIFRQALKTESALQNAQ